MKIKEFLKSNILGRDYIIINNLKIIILIFAVIIISGCDTTINNNGGNITKNELLEPEFSTNDPPIKKYLNLWEQKRLEDISKDYFDEHIRVIYAGNERWAEGTSPYFEVEYYYLYDWIVVRLRDIFIVRKGDGGELTDKEILTNMVFHGDHLTTIGKLHKIMPLNRTVTKDKAISLLHEKCSDKLNFEVRIPKHNELSGVYLINGKFSTRASGIINESQNACIYAFIDLGSGEVYRCQEGACWVT